jgi:hypothetical protein
MESATIVAGLRGFAQAISLADVISNCKVTKRQALRQL